MRLRVEHESGKAEDTLIPIGGQLAAKHELPDATENAELMAYAAWWAWTRKGWYEHDFETWLGEVSITPIVEQAPKVVS